MQYNFDEIVDRSGSNAVKLEKLKPVFGYEDLIPFWVADMDFKSPPAIIEALKQRVEHGVFGYTLPSDAYTSSIVNWLERRHRWQVKEEHINFVPGVVKGFAFAIDEFTEKGDKIIIQPPVYHPFRIVTTSLGREVVNNPLILENGQYKMDFEGLRRIVSDSDCKMLILCNPHNPGGRVWSPEELEELADICYENNILVVSDEIHADMALPGYQHTPFASVSAKAEEISLTLMAPSKTFNIAGIVSSFAVITNKTIRERYLAYLEPRELQQGTIFAFTATRAAYDECEEWLDQMLDYVQTNIDFVNDYLKENIPEIRAIMPEASFLVWLDCRALSLSQQELVNLFVEKAHLALNNGTMFGPGGEGFMRLNVGCPRTILEKGLNNLKKAVHP
ncbi:MalY/PatB family protein [Proteiniphilum acetatigenes]|uniref:MalY/PatB family protein n=1 Tax=Proteiniphilum acetatigenes TaxID=294710 RepID=UPI00037A0523|nr:PatB family C-S lyase [Proteiniphilum acetatigenes]SFK64296.1 cystathione beta-lyase [Porphyromonadaceae bacterium KH3CP3RA]